ncbi:MAG: hypothetical protein K0R25_140 [Rickettsiaceae bacterium]|jgi:uncharacterized protein YbaA (DUF1428 family)|nr:hypothetical protein [Rickettsiaceae bacterium]
MSYVDGFVLCVPTKNLAKYKKMAQAAGKVWKKHGAISYVEAVADDVAGNGFCITFPEMAKPKKGETVLFSFITYKSRRHRDSVNKKVMADMKNEDCSKMEKVFDFKRMAYSGFKPIVEF